MLPRKASLWAVSGIALTALASAPSWAQCTVAWTRLGMIGPLAREHPAVCDVGGVTLLFGGWNQTYLGDTWVWDGSRWTQKDVPGPVQRTSTAMAWDFSRGKVVLFGGYGGSSTYGPQGDTYEWNGTSWTSVSTTGPGARYGHSMAFDGKRLRTVLFGGHSSTGVMGDTWIWNGLAWTRVATTGPAAREDTAMAYDSSRSVVVLFGGRNGSTYYDDVWEWDGSAWTKRTPSTTPGSRMGHVLTYDSARKCVLLHGGCDAKAQPLGDTWEWNGTAWARRATTGPSPRKFHGITYDSAHSLAYLFHGTAALGLCGDVWVWDGAARTWTFRCVSGPGGARHGHAMAYDSDRAVIVLFGGAYGTTYGDTWEWDGRRWQPRNIAGPTARYGHAMAYDSDRHRIVLYGGNPSLGGPLNDTWEYDGAAWTKVATTGPPSLREHAMAYDPVRHNTVLFGGYTGTARYNGTWTWNGTAWTQMMVTGPLAVYGHAMAYDPYRQRVVLFGGDAGGLNVFPILTEWDGSRWTSVHVSGTEPGDRSHHGMAYDTARRRMVVFGGITLDGVRLNDTWELNGDSWAQMATTGPDTRSECPMAYDVSRNTMLLSDGIHGTPSSWGCFGDMWQWTVAGVPSVSANPVSLSVPNGGTATFTIGYSGGGDILIAWRHNGVVLADDGRIVGSASKVLTISPVRPSDAGEYDALVWNTCGTVATTTATLTVTLSTVDAVNALRIAGGLVASTTADVSRLDVNGVPGITVADATLVLRRVHGL